MGISLWLNSPDPLKKAIIKDLADKDQTLRAFLERIRPVARVHEVLEKPLLQELSFNKLGVRKWTRETHLGDIPMASQGIESLPLTVDPPCREEGQ